MNWAVLLDGLWVLARRIGKGLIALSVMALVIGAVVAGIGGIILAFEFRLWLGIGISTLIVSLLIGSIAESAD